MTVVTHTAFHALLFDNKSGRFLRCGWRFRRSVRSTWLSTSSFWPSPKRTVYRTFEARKKIVLFIILFYFILLIQQKSTHFHVILLKQKLEPTAVKMIYGFELCSDFGPPHNSLCVPYDNKEIVKQSVFIWSRTVLYKITFLATVSSVWDFFCCELYCSSTFFLVPYPAAVANADFARLKTDKGNALFEVEEENQ